MNRVRIVCTCIGADKEKCDGMVRLIVAFDELFHLGRQGVGLPYSDHRGASEQLGPGERLRLSIRFQHGDREIHGLVADQFGWTLECFLQNRIQRRCVVIPLGPTGGGRHANADIVAVQQGFVVSESPLCGAAATVVASVRADAVQKVTIVKTVVTESAIAEGVFRQSGDVVGHKRASSSG